MRSVSLMECNRQQPTISVLEAFAKALGMHMSELLHEVEQSATCPGKQGKTAGTQT